MHSDYELYKMAQSRIAAFHQAAAQDRLSRRAACRPNGPQPRAPIAAIVIRSMAGALAAALRWSGSALIAAADLLRAPAPERDCVELPNAADNGC